MNTTFVTDDNQYGLAIKQLLLRDEVALDLETTGLNPLTDEVLLIGIDEFVFHPDYLEHIGRKVVANPKIIKHIFNAAFDGMFFQVKGIMPQRVVDPMIGAMLLKAGLYSPEGTFKLGNLLKVCLGVEHDKQLQTSFIGADPATFTPSAEQLSYLQRDVAYLSRLSRWVGDRLRSAGMSDVWRLENAFTQVIAEMQLHGAPVDVANYSGVVQGWERRRQELETQLTETLTPSVMEVRLKQFQALDFEHMRWLQRYEQATQGYEVLADQQEFVSKRARRSWIMERQAEWRERFNRPDKPHLNTAPITLTSHQQLLQSLNHLGVQVKDTQRTTLARAKLVSPPEIHPLIDQLAEYSKLEKLTSTYGTNLIARLDADNRLRSRYTQIKATGRISSGRDEESDTGFNLQNPHPEFRKHIVAPDGRTFVILDYGQIELRIAAELILRRDPSASDALVEAFRQGLDPHSVLALRIGGIDRKAAKVGNFSTMYGIAPDRMALRIHAESKTDEPFGQKYIDLAKQVQQGFWDSNPTLRTLLRDYEYQAIRDGYTTTLGGRRRYYDKVEKGTPEWHSKQGIIRRAGANHPIQGLSADVMKLAGVLVQRRLRLNNYGSAFIWNLVHDEVCIETDNDNITDIVDDACREAYETFIKHVPYSGDCKIVQTWAK